MAIEATTPDQKKLIINMMDTSSNATPAFLSSAARICKSWITDKDLRKAIKKAYLRGVESQRWRFPSYGPDVQWAIYRRGEMGDLLSQMGNPPKVLHVVEQMDCDCAHWTSETEMDANPRKMLDAWCDTFDHAEGPVYQNRFRPVRERGHHVTKTRDLALEAFEDGHPHVVYTYPAH